MRQLKVLMTGSLLSTLAACQAGSATDEEPLTDLLPENLTPCRGDRPDVCTQQYDPVCGYFQPGPDDEGLSSSKDWATESGATARQQRTFGNACSACAEKKVVGFVRGECPTPKED